MLEIARDKSDPYHVAIAETVFDGTDNTWAYFPSNKPGRLRKIPIAEMFKGAGDEVGAGSSFAYDGPYCHNRKINLSQVFAGQLVGVRQETDRIWLVRFMHYDLGYFDDETCRLEPIQNPFGPALSPVSPE